MRSRVISWLAVAGLMSGLCACGSSSPATTSAATHTRTPAEAAALAAYIARADHVCSVGNRAIAPINARGAAIELRHADSAREAALMVPVLRVGLREYRHFYRRFELIAPPPHDGATVAAILDGLRRVGNDLERLELALKRGDTTAAGKITAEREMDHARVSALELEFGFKVCGQPAAHSSLDG